MVPWFVDLVEGAMATTAVPKHPIHHHVVPSHTLFRSFFPDVSVTRQWRGVYHASSLTNHLKWLLMLDRKRLTAAERIKFQKNVESLLAVDAERTSGKSKFSSPVEQRLHAAKLNSFGFPVEAAYHVNELLAKQQLTSDHCAQLIESYSARNLQESLAKTSANYDRWQAQEMMGDRSASTRLSEAERLFDCVAKPSTRHYNALMATALTCGFDAAKRVSGQMYDTMGVNRVAPNVHTYGLVMKALALQGETQEANAILNWLRANHPGQLNIELFNNMLAGYRRNREFDRCDEMWTELVDRRVPAANVETAETYIRSIIDLCYTPTSAPLTRYGAIHQVEKKRIPLVLAQMETLAIPVMDLSPPVIDEVEDALRKYVITRDRFYSWGRAVNLFSFVEFRKQAGWAYDLEEATPTTLVKAGPPKLTDDPDAPRAGDTGRDGLFQLPGNFHEVNTWERPALEDALNLYTIGERNDDTGTAAKWEMTQTPIHDRSSTWMQDVPKTRYDGLYGRSKIPIDQIGVRRHLLGDKQQNEDIMTRDAAVLSSSLKSARRVRHKVETTRTHRNSAE